MPECLEIGYQLIASIYVSKELLGEEVLVVSVSLVVIIALITHAAREHAVAPAQLIDPVLELKASRIVLSTMRAPETARFMRIKTRLLIIEEKASASQ